MARGLAAAFGGEWSAEAARAYAERRRAGGRSAALAAADVEPIAREQLALEDAAAGRRRPGDRRLVVRDTDLVSTVVYARHYYGACPAWIVDAARARRADLYLLLSPDGMPWVPDAVRDTAAARAALTPAFRSTLRELGCTYVEVDGDWHARAGRAHVLVGAILGAQHDGA